MRPSDVLRTARQRGIRLAVDGGLLRYKAPPGALTEELLGELKRWKPELLDMLTTFPCDTCGRFAFHQPTTCYWCATASEVEA